ncbi:MAG: serine hydrolase [Clostridia bacterium]|nr:serine hydrolase [Clostridia bacterium]
MAAVVCVSAFLPAFASSALPSGDVNGDGLLNASDYYMLKRYVLKTFALSDEAASRGDMDGNGLLNMRDYLLLKRAVLPPAPPEPVITEGLPLERTTGVFTNLPAGKADELTAILSGAEGVSVYYCALDGSDYYGFNTAGRHRTASTAKLPYCHWLCLRADRGEIDMEERLVYDASRLRDGSAILEKAKDGQTFSVRELMDYSIRFSDNTAFRMLVSRFGTARYKEWLRPMGVTFVPERYALGECDAADMGILLYEFVRYRAEGSANADFLWESGTHSAYGGAVVNAFRNCTVFHKFGALFPPSNPTYNDVAVVMAKKPFLLVILTDFLPSDGEKTALFRKICGCVKGWQ